MSALQRAIDHARETAVLQAISATLEWDERTKMPAAAGPYRAKQITLLSGLIHQRETDQHYGEWLEQAWQEVDKSATRADEAATVRVLRREFDKATKLPQHLVEALTKNEIEGQQAWIEARRLREFPLLQPFLERTIELNREVADALGYDECKYDALLDKYEPDEKTSNVRQIFASLRDRLVSLLQEIVGSGKEIQTDFLRRHYPEANQHRIGLLAAKRIGFRFEDGRLDVTNHPFCTTLGPRDVRLTTRYDERCFPTAFFGTLHEAGHGIYEQGLRTDWCGLPPGKHCSMAIHESQSRLYENLVGRSEPFWRHLFPELKTAFPTSLEGVSREQFYQAINSVKPSLIRVEADEVTYNLHIIIRFELEQELINGDLAVADLPEAWNDRYQQVLGVTPPHDGDGVLQDIHWSAGDIGYFPTYALGNLYAAQLFEQAEADLGDFASQFQSGGFSGLQDWLGKNVHQRGQCYSAADLVQQITGKPLTEDPLVNQLRSKFEAIYGI